jgi:predicted amidophosphoribosyltransferase
LLVGKKVILIDDVITRGRTFTQTASKILANGASSVTGMFVAKTVNPDWNNMVA